MFNTQTRNTISIHTTADYLELFSYLQQDLWFHFICKQDVETNLQCLNLLG